MAQNIYKDAWNYALDELRKQYISEDRENEFDFNFNINYVSDDNNVITVSVPSLFMKNQVISKGSLNIIKNKIHELTGLNNLTLECIINNETSEKSESEADAVRDNSELKDYEKTGDEDKILPSSSKEEESQPVKEMRKHPQLDDRYIFEK